MSLRALFGVLFEGSERRREDLGEECHLQRCLAAFCGAEVGIVVVSSFQVGRRVDVDGEMGPGKS